MFGTLIFILLLPLFVLIGTVVMARSEARSHDWRFEVSRVVSNTFVPFGRGALPILLVSFVANALPAMVLALVPGAASAGGALTGPFASTVPQLVSYLLVGTLGDVATIALARVALRAERPALGAALRQAVPLLLPAIGVRVLFWLGVTAASFLLLVPGIMLAVAWVVAMPALVADRAGVFRAFGRSVELTRGARWRIFLIALVVLLLYGLAAMVLGVAVVALGSSPVLLTPASAIVSTLLGPLPPLALTALHHELDTAKGGSDTETLEAVFA